MAGNGFQTAQFLAPPAVTALRQEARTIDPNFSPSMRSVTDNMQEEREDLREAAEQTLNVIVDLDLDGRIKWVSPSWKQVVGTPAESVEGRMISELLAGNKNVFHDAIESLKEDDSRSRFIRFAVHMGPDSVLKYSPEPQPLDLDASATEGEAPDTQEEAPAKPEERNNDIINMEGQGIMAFDRTSSGTGHVSVTISTHRDLDGNPGSTNRL